MSPLSTTLLRVIHDEIGGYETSGVLPEGATAAVHARVMIELLPIRAALEARAKAMRANQRYGDLVERSTAEGWDDDPVKSTLITSAANQWVVAVNDSERALDTAARLMGVSTLTEPGEGDS